ncbi:MAG TPA: class I SAM-dependent methyltransferase [Mycobacteriales bacterium]|jgi:SAM-dependent methyltransferase|nr:class I SAM-dependent methyltransferase [Mycobacteriales bacterium]
MGEPTYLTDARAAYDTVASTYADLLRNELAGKPVDRAVIAIFAELVTGNGGGWVADVGCGPGRVAAHLAKLGLDVFGVDLSTAMLQVAQREYPYLSFFAGQLSNLALHDGTVGGIVAWYSIIHTPPDRLRDTFVELRRVMASGAALLLAFQVGDERVHITHAYDHDVSLHAWRLEPAHIRTLLTDVGLTVHTEVLRAAEGHEKTPQSYLLALKL